MDILKRTIKELNRGDSKVNPEVAIGGIKQDIEQLKRQMKQNTLRVVPAGGGGTAGKTVLAYDLSPSLNGSTKTFSLPAFYRVIAIECSSLTPLRLTTDYTVDGNLMQITFTSQVDAATVLATGQSCVVLYSTQS